jgi:hypothetical protein
VRAALVSIAGQPRDAARNTPIAIAGKTLARRQLDFTLAAGCERVIALGDGASPEAIALRHVAEAAGARFDAIRDALGLLGAVKAADELLVLAPGLLPEAPAALELLGKGNKVLVFPAGSGTAAGFERIDLERAWAGAVLVTGALVERLAELPADTEPAAALLRVALQARVREVRLPDELLTDGSWAFVGENESSGSRDNSWLKRNLRPVQGRAFAPWLARLTMTKFAVPLLGMARALAGMVAIVAVLLVGAVGASAYGIDWLGFALAAIGALATALAGAFAGLRHVPFGAKGSRFQLSSALSLAVDLTIAGCAGLSSREDPLNAWFPPLVLLGALHAGRAGARADWGALLADRAVLAGLFAIAAVLGLAEPAIMLAALALIALEVAKPAAGRG